MVEELDSGGFRTLLDKSVRLEEDADWSVHTVDYDQFKKRLKTFAFRRKRVRTMLRDSPDGRVAKDAVTQLLEGPTRPLRPDDIIPNLDELPPELETSYIPLEEQSDGSSANNSGGSKDGVFVRGRRSTKRRVMRRLSISERNEVTLFLAQELDKAFMFYLSQWQVLSRRLEKQQSLSGAPSLDPSLGDEILELFAFCVINVLTTQQILIRYDAFARAFEGTPMRNYFLKQVMERQCSFKKILFHDELNAIADSYATGNETLPLVVHFCAQRFMFSDILATLDGITDPTPVHMMRKGQWLKSMLAICKWSMVGLFEDRLGLEPAYLTDRGKSLTAQMEQMSLWRRKKHEILRPIPEQKLTGMQRYHLALNLISAFLYCMNYYIVEPSSAMYVSRLGAHDTMNGVLIGMLPLAAFVSAIPYSMWTNDSFRSPFIVSSFLLMLGNLVYSLSDVYQSLPMALMGRFISGLGAPKCIIRRFIADTTPMSLRTGVNAGFGMVVAAGSAMGPAMAVILNQFETVARFPGYSPIYLNGLTLPGYFMAALWGTFTVIVLTTFDEPDRQGLKEQKAMEDSSMAERPTTPTGGFSPRSEGDLVTVFSEESHDYSRNTDRLPPQASKLKRLTHQILNFADLITLSVRLCLGLLLAKVFTIEALVSATSSLSKLRYRWHVRQVGTLGFINGIIVIPFSMLVGRLSLSYQDHILMRWLVGFGCLGMFLLIDLSDLVSVQHHYGYNEGHPLAVTPQRYIAGYFLSYISIQAFEGVIGSSLSKVIPTALASGTFNSGLLATLVDTFGRACGDMFISTMGSLNHRQLMNLLFIPGFSIMFACLVAIVLYHDLLSV